MVCPLFVDYGQRAASAEWRAAKAIAGSLGTEPVSKLRITGLRAGFDFGLLGAGTADGAVDEYVPQRNLLLATLAAMYAETVGAVAVALGVWGDGEDQYPDTTRSFIRSLDRLLRASSNLRVLAPFAGDDKEALVSYGMRSGLDYTQTWSCGVRNDIHCGRCRSCEERALSLRLIADIRTPTAVAGGT